METVKNTIDELGLFYFKSQDCSFWSNGTNMLGGKISRNHLSQTKPEGSATAKCTETPSGLFSYLEVDFVAARV